MHEITRIIDAARSMARGVLVTVVRTEGSTYRRAGARAVIGDDGRAFGTISGGCLERDLAERVRALLAAKKGKKLTEADIEDAMSGNLCRCGTYQRIRKAIHRAAGAA